MPLPDLEFAISGNRKEVALEGKNALTHPAIPKKTNLQGKSPEEIAHQAEKEEKENQKEKDPKILVEDRQKEL